LISFGKVYSMIKQGGLEQVHDSRISAAVKAMA
jgi:hypothetical protein